MLSIENAIIRVVDEERDMEISYAEKNNGTGFMVDQKKDKTMEL
jgi:hypothetical protein